MLKWVYLDRADKLMPLKALVMFYALILLIVNLSLLVHCPFANLVKSLGVYLDRADKWMPLKALEMLYALILLSVVAS